MKKQAAKPRHSRNDGASSGAGKISSEIILTEIIRHEKIFPKWGDLNVTERFRCSQ
ncbi:hypothetical protein [Pseudophaeobacter sp.]|uniref:hypothetical protein n=1 Tax=Pseudophaeobacter sp. TaxID=1971739 RepID=UPI0032969EB7